MTPPISDSCHLRDYSPRLYPQTGLQAHLHPSRDPNDGAHYRHMTTSSHQATMAGWPSTTTGPVAGPLPQGFVEYPDHEGTNWLSTPLTGCLFF